jgi:peroxiredoxin-like protein
MAKDRFRFTARVSWLQGKDGVLEAPDLPSIAVSAPVEFKGRAHTWTPEHLAIGSAASCYMATFAAVAEASKLDFKSLTVDADGTVEKAQSGYELTEIVLKAALIVRDGKDVNRASRLLEKAKEHCIISKAMRAPVTLQADVFHDQTPTCPCPTVEVETAEPT